MVDLPLFICGALGFHLILLSFFDKNKTIYYVPIFWLSLFGPVIKLTGIIIPMYFVVSQLRARSIVVKVSIVVFASTN